MAIDRFHNHGYSVKYAAKGSKVIECAKSSLRRHQLFRSHLESIEVEYVEGHLVLLGRLPSFYLRQALQQALRDVPEAGSIENLVDVVSCNGLSSVRKTKTPRANHHE